MENLLKITFGETQYFAKVLQHTKHGFEIETLFPVEGIKYSETSAEDFAAVRYFEERVLAAFREKLIFEIGFLSKKTLIKQKLRELEFSLMIFIDDEQTPEKQQRIRQIFGEQFYTSNFPYFEFTQDMVKYLLDYLDFSYTNLNSTRVISEPSELFLARFEHKAIHSIINTL